MVPPIRIFLDTSILAEYKKGTKTDLLDELIQRQYLLCYNQIVLSEYLFVTLAHYGQKSLRTLKMANYIPELLDKHDVESLLQPLHFLKDVDASVAYDVPRFMREYNLLPNDAIIFSHCQSSGIKCLASYDADFQPICRKEGVILIDSVDVLNTHFPVS
ncbi:type II toxin-antitoxin system VapC family toxin [Spirosoma harenae]